MDTADRRLLRENLIQVKAWIEHWQQDIRFNLKPTDTSLATVKEIVAQTIRTIEREATP